MASTEEAKESRMARNVGIIQQVAWQATKTKEEKKYVGVSDRDRD